jgi:hypothetical protein
MFYSAIARGISLYFEQDFSGNLPDSIIMIMNPSLKAEIIKKTYELNRRVKV